MTQEFTAQIEKDERSRVFISIPFNPKEIWGQQSRYYVEGTISGTPFSSSLGVHGGSYFFPFNKEMQQQTGLKPGDSAKISISPASEESRNNEMPADLAESLAAHKSAGEFFDTLSAFYKNSYIKWITSAKQAETRAKRVTETTELLAQGKKQR